MLAWDRIGLNTVDVRYEDMIVDRRLRLSPF
jgi:hypothetical protein